MEAPIVSGVTDIEQESLHNPFMSPGLNNTPGETNNSSWLQGRPRNPPLTWTYANDIMKTPTKKYTQRLKHLDTEPDTLFA
jgi:hypothetical protein